MFIFLRVVVGRQGCNQLGATLLLHFFRRRRRHRSTLNWFVPDANIFLFAQHQYFVASLYNVYLWFTLICTQGCAKIGSFFTRCKHLCCPWYTFLVFHAFQCFQSHISFSPDLPSMLLDKSDLWSRKMSNNWLNSTPLYFTPWQRAGIDIVKSWKTWRGKSRSWENFLQGKVF